MFITELAPVNVHVKAILAIKKIHLAKNILLVNLTFNFQDECVVTTTKR